MSEERGMINETRSSDLQREPAREPVQVEGSLRDARAVQADGVEGLTATIQGRGRRYGEVYHVTFPPTRDLDLWVAAVSEAWIEAQAQRAGLAQELPDWMRPSQGAPARGANRAGVRPSAVRQADSPHRRPPRHRACRARAVPRAGPGRPVASAGAVAPGARSAGTKAGLRERGAGAKLAPLFW